MTTAKTTNSKATTRKTTTAKKTAATPKKVEPTVETVQSQVEETVTPTVETVITPEVKEEPKILRSVSQIGQHEMFEVRSLTHNPLIYIDKRTGNVYEWQNYGDIEMIPFADLMTMRNRDRKFIENMRICFEDDEIIHAFGLTKKYEEVFSNYNGDILLERSVHELREIIPALPKGIKNSLVSRAREIAKSEIESGEYDLLDSTLKMKIIQEHLGLDLSLLLEK